MLKVIKKIGSPHQHHNFCIKAVNNNYLSFNNINNINNIHYHRYYSSSSRSPSSFMKPFIGAIDQGTSSTRFILFDKNGDTLLSHQVPLTQHYPHPGWVEHDGKEILDSVNICIEKVMEEFHQKNYGTKEDIKAVGITNQRETTVAWDKNTSKPLHNAIVWCDTRTSDLVSYFTNKAKKSLKTKQDGASNTSGATTIVENNNTVALEPKNYLREKCGLPFSTYFSAVKLKWLFENSKQVKESYQEGNCKVGTVDSWLAWNLSGGKLHITDVTNASRTMLMDLHTCKWDKELTDFFEIPIDVLPEIKSSSEVYGHIHGGPLDGVPLASILGDQQAAMVGQMCFEKSQAKNTYGTGCFLLYNTGEKIVPSRNGLLTTVCYQLGPKAPVIYALEGGVAVAGSGVQWLINNMGIASSSKEIEDLAHSVKDTGGMYFVPAFSGLFAPYWREDARGVMVGLNHQTNKAHLALSVLESTCYQTYEVLEAMQKDSGDKLIELRVDGGMAKNNLMLQIQSDILGLPVLKPTNLETTCFGAAFSAGMAVGVWKESMEFKTGMKFTPQLDETTKSKKIKGWHKAISKSINWIDLEDQEDQVDQK